MLAATRIKQREVEDILEQFYQADDGIELGCLRSEAVDEREWPGQLLKMTNRASCSDDLRGKRRESGLLAQLF